MMGQDTHKYSVIKRRGQGERVRVDPDRIPTARDGCKLTMAELVKVQPGLPDEDAAFRAQEMRRIEAEQLVNSLDELEHPEFCGCRTCVPTVVEKLVFSLG